MTRYFRFPLQIGDCSQDINIVILSTLFVMHVTLRIQLNITLFDFSCVDLL